MENAMKICLGLIFLLTSLSSFAGKQIDSQITCSGVGEMKATFFDKKKDTVFYFNDPEVREDNYNYEPGDGTVPFILGHKVVVGRKTYIHSPLGSASCKNINKNEIKCIGSGFGNGPALDITINKKTGIGSGTYFNADAERGVNYPNDYNTYRYDRVVCKL